MLMMMVMKMMRVMIHHVVDEVEPGAEGDREYEGQNQD